MEIQWCTDDTVDGSNPASVDKHDIYIFIYGIKTFHSWFAGFCSSQLVEDFVHQLFHCNNEMERLQKRYMVFMFEIALRTEYLNRAHIDSSVQCETKMQSLLSSKNTNLFAIFIWRYSICMNDLLCIINLQINLWEQLFFFPKSPQETLRLAGRKMAWNRTWKTSGRQLSELVVVSVAVDIEVSLKWWGCWDLWVAYDAFRCKEPVSVIVGNSLGLRAWL